MSQTSPDVAPDAGDQHVPFWSMLFCHSAKIEALTDWLTEHDVEWWVPCKKVRYRMPRSRKIVVRERQLMPGSVLVESRCIDFISLHHGNPFISAFRVFQPNGRIARIPDTQMEGLRTCEAEEPAEEEVAPRLVPGTRIFVMTGPLQGCKGMVVGVRHKAYVVSLDESGFKAHLMPGLLARVEPDD